MFVGPRVNPVEKEKTEKKDCSNIYHGPPVLTKDRSKYTVPPPLYSQVHRRSRALQDHRPWTRRLSGASRLFARLRPRRLVGLLVSRP